jgi:large subunit ribosomal protein L25
MESIHLAVKTRDMTGKKVKALRAEGLIPAELYGHGVENVHLSVPAKEFNKVFKTAGSSTMITLDLGHEKRPAMIHDVLRDNVRDDILHVDFYQVRLDEKITAHVPLEFVGESAAVKEKQAVITKAISEIEVEALPQDVPHTLTVDLALLDDLNKSIYVKDIVVPKGVEIQIDGESVVATAQEPAKEEEVVAEAAPMDVADIKVESEEKKAERDAAKAAGEAKAE